MIPEMPYKYTHDQMQFFVDWSSDLTSHRNTLETKTENLIARSSSGTEILILKLCYQLIMFFFF